MTYNDIATIFCWVLFICAAVVIYGVVYTMATTCCACGKSRRLHKKDPVFTCGRFV